MIKSWLVLVSFRVVLLAASGETIAIGMFSMNNFSGWNEKSFKGRMVYEFVKDDQINKTVVQVQTRGAASGRFKKNVVILPERLS
jgi:hypothetical protein